MLRDSRRPDFSGKTLVRYKSHGMRFEIVVNPDVAIKIKRGDLDLNEDVLHELLEIDEVFTNASRGEKAAESDLELAFETTDLLKIVQKLMKDGELLLTAEHRREMLETKKRRIIDYIARNSMDPKTRRPHTPARIERALEEARVQIDINRPVEEQAKEIVKQIRAVLPIVMERVRMAVRIPAEFTGKAYGEVKRYADIEKEVWKNGDWYVQVTLAAGMTAQFMDHIGSLTKGMAEFKIIEHVDL